MMWGLFLIPQPGGLAVPVTRPSPPLAKNTRVWTELSPPVSGPWVQKHVSTALQWSGRAWGELACWAGS